jgi:DNA-binding transcriptional regulator GbsR (MarR family)
VSPAGFTPGPGGADDGDMQDSATAGEARTRPELSATARKFIRDWGDLADRWGIDRTTAEVHALLYVAGAALDLRTVAERLSVPADEAAAGLEALRRMGVARIVDRTAGTLRYQCVPDLWEAFQAILEERRRRELEPAMAALRDAVLRADSDPGCDDATRRRLEDMQAFLRDGLGLYKQLSALPGAQVRRLFKMGGKIRRALGLDDA